MRIEVERGNLAEEAVALLYARRPELADRYGPTGRSRCVEDTTQTVIYLGEAISNDSYALFREYLTWLKVVCANFNIDLRDIADSLICLAEVLEARLPQAEGRRAAAMLRTARRDFDEFPLETTSLIVGNAPTMVLARSYLDALLQGDRRRAGKLILDQVEAGLSVTDVYLKVFQPVLREVGRLWHTNKITVADEHYVTAATQATMAQLYPYIFTGEARGRAMVATCVGGELHEVGMRMVADCFEMAGWDSYYLGANVPAKDVLSAVAQHKASVLAISATIARHIGQVSGLVALARAEFQKSVVILVGGYPFNIDSNLWRRVGADGMAADAGGAVGVVAALEAARSAR